jgi:trehalose 6-phosphate phosphatase
MGVPPLPGVAAGETGWLPLPAPPLPPPDATALFLDIDGTLVDLAETPDAVTVAPGLHGLLSRLRSRLNGALAVVSGRPLDGIDGLFAPLALDAAGQHGAEWRRHGERGALPPPPPAFAEIATGLRRFAVGHPGVRMEDKGAALALHTRLAPDVEDAALAVVEDALRRLGGAYRLQVGSAVAELVPAAATKGRGIERLLAEPPYAGRAPVFIGDDLTDESGFAAAGEHGGFGILVGPPRATAARYRLAAVADVHAWLETLAGRS